MGRIFLTAEFGKFARKQRIAASILVQSIQAADQGSVQASLAGCLVKLRVSRPGEGKSGGYRMVVAFKTGERAFFLYGFAKNVRANITRDEEEALEKYGQLLLSLSDLALIELLDARKLTEITE